MPDHSSMATPRDALKCGEREGGSITRPPPRLIRQAPKLDSRVLSLASAKPHLYHHPLHHQSLLIRDTIRLYTTKMAADLLQPPAYQSPAEALRVSQQAPVFFKSQARSILPYPLSILTSSESPEQWHSYENLLVACLRTGDDDSALQCIKELTERFGEENERLQNLAGLYQEATAKDDKALANILSSYELILTETPTNFPIRKRRAALLKSMGKTTEAIKAMIQLLNLSPIDAEAWAELSQLYFSQAMYSQSVYCLEEVLLVTPNAWNVRLLLLTLLSDL